MRDRWARQRRHKEEQEKAAKAEAAKQAAQAMVESSNPANNYYVRAAVSNFPLLVEKHCWGGFAPQGARSAVFSFGAQLLRRQSHFVRSWILLQRRMVPSRSRMGSSP